jgi:hypothetical protein
MVIRIDIVYAIGLILKLIIIQLELPDIVIIIYTDLYSFYEYLVKLGTTKKKYFMIDIIAFRQSYKHKELFKVR